MNSTINSYFQTFFKQSNTAVLLVDGENMNIIEFNESVSKLYNWSNPNEFINQPFYQVCTLNNEKFTQTSINQLASQIVKKGNYTYQTTALAEGKIEFYAGINISVLTVENINYFIVCIDDVTNEIKNRHDLELTKEAYKSVYYKLPNGIITHINGKIRSCNDAFLSYRNIERRDLYGTKFIELFNKEDQDLINKQIQNPVKGDVIIVRGLNVDDVWRKYTMESFQERFLDEDVVVSFMTDYQLQEDFTKEQLRANIASEANALLEKEINKHKETRKKLEQSQEISKSVFNSSIDTIISTDLNNNITEVSPSACYTFGYDMNELLGQKSHKLYAIEEEFVDIEKQLKADGFYIGEITNKRKDGTRFTSFLSCAAMRNNKGNQIGFMGISRDITDIKKAEVELVESERKYRDLFINLSDALIVVNEKNIILELNRAAKSLFQIEDNKKYSLIDFVYEEDKNYVQKKSKEFRKKGSIVNVEFRIKTQKSHIRVVNLSSSAIYSGDNFIGSRDIIRDITEQKEAEFNLNKSIKEKEVLLKEVHHRVKNNLQVISSILNLQSSYVKDENTLSILRESQNRVKSMSFIHESLYRSKDFSEVNFSDYINNLVNNIIHSFHLSNSNVKLITDLGGVNLNLDQAIPCGLIINELLTNAMKYAYKDVEAPELFISISQIEKLININIKDNGIGLPKGFKIDESDSLGLQLVQTLIEQLEGTLSLNVEKGTNYFITFEKVT